MMAERGGSQRHVGSVAEQWEASNSGTIARANCPRLAPSLRKTYCKLLGLVAFLTLSLASIRAQTFQSIAPLSFTKVYQGGDPPAQVITAASTGASFSFNYTTVNSTGGTWLSISPNSGTPSTPRSITVSAHPDVTLAPGNYSAEITLTSFDRKQAITIPVSLIIAPVSAPSFDETNGALTFSLVTKGSAPPLQNVPIRNAGNGTLSWTASASTADGGKWLTLSAQSGTAPSDLQVGINPANLPTQGLSVGTFVGQVVLQTNGDRTTIPVTVTVGASVFRQMNPLSFTKAYQGDDPPAQVITGASTGANFSFNYNTVNSTGGTWLSISPNSGTPSTPRSITVSANPDITLAPGTYAAEIILTAFDGTQASVIPVSLTIAPPTVAFFDQTPGELTFSLVTKGSAPPVLDVPIRNAGSGTLNWTASASTADGGNWLTLSVQSGIAPGDLQVSINPANLPTQGLSAGTFVGQIVLQTDNDRTTIPVTVTVGDSVFRQINPLSFTKAYQGADPPSQVITATSTGANFSFNYNTVNSTGGTWLSIFPNSGTPSTPRSITVSANPAVTLAPGTYTAEIILTAFDGTQASVIPVSLTIAPPTAAFFDQTPGELTFSLVTRGNAPPLQYVPIRNAGNGTLNWTASASTADGGNWLTLSAQSGTAPGSLQVGINPANLPTQGLSAGTFVGQVVLQTGGDRTTIPVTVTVGASVFRQINALSFTKAYQGGDPPAQVITAASTGANFSFNYNTVNSTGGKWLSVSPNGGTPSTPRSITVSANPDITLAPGTYTAEIILTAFDGTQASVIPVSLTIAPPTAAFFDATEGALTFSMQPAGSAPPAKPIQIRNGGMGTLNWTASASTADGGNWLILSAQSGTTPYFLSVAVDPTQLPGQGLSAGVFVGQVVLQSDTDRVTVPVTFTLGTSVFSPLGELSFNKPYQGANPPSQVITAASTGTNFSFNFNTVNSTGGAWLAISPNSGTPSTPRSITVSANPALTFNPGTYTAEIILTAFDGTQASVIPVFLTVGGAPTPTATPTFSPSTGTYTTAQSVAIADTTAGATIYYTTNGSTPTTNSPQYSGPITVSSNETLEAIAVASGSTQSSVASASYTFTSATASTSSLAFGNQSTGTTSTAKTVTISNPGANTLGGFTLSLFGANASDFGLASNGCAGTVAGGGSCDISVTFSPQAASARSATLNVSYNGIGSPLSITLSGTGTTATKTTTITLMPSATTITYGQALSVTAALSGTPSPTGSITYSLDGGSVASAVLVAGGAALNLGVLPAGNHTLTVNYAGDSIYGSATQSLVVNVGKATVTAVAADATRAYGQNNPTFTYTVSGFVNGDTGAVLGGSATLGTTASTNAPVGRYAITFTSQALTASNYNITYTPGSLTVTPASQTITFNAPASVVYGASVTLAATASSGLPVSYGVSGPATLVGSILTATGVGNITVTASQAGDSNYAAAPSVDRSFNATTASQTISFTGLPTAVTFGQAGPYTLSATASSGLPVSYSVSGPANVSGSVLTLTGVGTVTVTASQAGNSSYSAASPVTQSIVVSAANQTISFVGLPATAIFGQAGPYTLNATASSGLPVSYTLSGPATLSGSVLTITGVGTVSVTASQTGNSSYAPAAPVTQLIVVSVASQTITFVGLPSTAIFGQAGPYTLNATASSGLPVSYSVSGPATLSGSVLTITSAGTVSVTASQPGNATYGAATPVTQTILVSAAPPDNGTVQLVTTGVLSRQQDGSYETSILVINLGTATAQNVVVTSVSVGNAIAAPLPQTLNDLPPGAYAVLTLSVPASAGAANSRTVERIAGTYDGGTFGGSLRVTLP